MKSQTAGSNYSHCLDKQLFFLYRENKKHLLVVAGIL
jgi:hypothetical protein